MMPRLRHDGGMSIIELAVSMFVAALLSVGLITWLAAAFRSNALQEQSGLGMDQMREGKSLIVRELRFANGLSTDPSKTNAHKVTVWIDRPNQGTIGAPDPGVGEWVTWEITADGLLNRSTDITGSPVVTEARGLVYASTGAAGTSVFTYPAPNTVGIVFVAAYGSATQSLETQVTLRNA